jgi:hypothetical protein
MTARADQQGDLFNHPLPPERRKRYPAAPGYARSSDTSKAAAAKVEPVMGRLQTIIFDYLTKRGEEGATFTEIARDCALKTQTVCGRVRELVLAERVKDSGQRRPTSPGASGRVYVVAR